MQERSGEERLDEETEVIDAVHPESDSQEEKSGEDIRDHAQRTGSPQRTDAPIATYRPTKEDKQDPPNEINKLKCRARAFSGAFVVMVSPVLLAIVLKKVNLNGDRQYQGIQMLQVVVDFIQRNFAHFAAATLQMGISPFLCVIISEACGDAEITSRWLALSKLLVLLSDILLMVLGCGILLLINMNASKVVSACFIMAVLVILVHVWSCYRYVRNDNVGGTDIDTEYHSKLEHSLDFSAGITVIMFLVLECVALDGLLRSTQGPCHLPQLLSPVSSPAPSVGLNPTRVTDQRRETFLGATLFISFLTSAWGALVMNIWTIPLGVCNNVVFTSAFMMGLNIFLAVATVAVVVLITWEGLQYVAVLTLFPPFIPILVLLARKSLGNMGDDDIEQQQQAAPHRDGEQPGQPAEEKKPAPLELTKVAFTGFLTVAVPSVTNTSLGMDTKAFVVFTGAAVLSGLLWRLLTHATSPSPAVLKAANQASFLAHACVFCAGIAFWIMAVNALKWHMEILGKLFLLLAGGAGMVAYLGLGTNLLLWEA